MQDNQDNQDNKQESKQINVENLRAVILSRNSITKLLIISLFFGFISYIYLISADQKYEVKAIVSAVEQETDNQGLGGIADSFSSITGMGKSSPVGYNKFLSLVVSERAAKAFIAYQDPRADLFGDNFDPSTGEIINVPLSLNLKKFIYFLIGRDLNLVIDAAALAGHLNEEVLVSVDRKTNFATLSYLTEDREVGIDLLTNLVKVVDSVLKEQEKKTVQLSIDYFYKQLDTVNKVTSREALVRGLASKEIEMSALGEDSSFVVEFVSPPTASSMPVTPGLFNTFLFCLTLIFVTWLFLILYSNKKQIFS